MEKRDERMAASPIDGRSIVDVVTCIAIN